MYILSSRPRIQTTFNEKKSLCDLKNFWRKKIVFCLIGFEITGLDGLQRKSGISRCRQIWGVKRCVFSDNVVFAKIRLSETYNFFFCNVGPWPRLLLNEAKKIWKTNNEISCMCNMLYVLYTVYKSVQCGTGVNGKICNCTRKIRKINIKLM